MAPHDSGEADLERDDADFTAQSRLAIGLDIRIDPPARPTPEHWAETLRLLDVVTQPRPLAHYFTVTPTTVSPPREFSGVSTLLRVLRRANVQSVGLSVERGSSYSIDSIQDGAEARLHFVAGDAGKGFTKMNLRRFVPSNTTSLSDVIAAMCTVFTHVNGISGHAHVSHDMTYVGSETLGYPSYPMTPRWPAEATYTRIRQLEPFRMQHDRRVLGAYWGTLLGPEHVATLGGVRRVQKEAPVARIELLEGGAMYLQATPIPEPITTPAMQLVLPKLEAYLTPVRVPVPYFELPVNAREVPLWWESQRPR